MRPSIRKVKKYRKFSDEFKRSIVKEYESGSSSIKELSLQNDIAQQLIYRWIYKFSKFNDKGYRIVEHSKSKTEKLQELQKENQALKAMLGDKQIKIEYLEKLIELAESDLKVDIKKNGSTPQSSSSEKTQKK